MDWVAFGYGSAGRLAVVILLGVMLGYGISRPNKSAATRDLLALTACFLVISSAHLVMAVFPPFERTFLFNLVAIPLTISILASGVVFIRFSYRFRGSPFPQEEWAVWHVLLVIIGLLWSYACFQILVRSDVTLIPFLLGFMTKTAVVPTFLWGVVVLIRKMLRTRRDTDGQSVQALRAYRAFAGVGICFAVVGTFNAVGVAAVHWPLLAIALFGLAVTFMNYGPDPTPFRIRLIGMMLTTVLVCLVFVEWVLASALIVPPDAQVAPSTLHLKPSPEGGYTAQELAPAPIKPVGEIMVLNDDEDRRITLPFPFRFYGQEWDVVFVSANAALSFNTPLNIPRLDGARFNPLLVDAATPKVLVAYADFAPHQGGTVAIEQTETWVRVTWANVPLFNQPARLGTCAVVLHRTGEITLAYEHMGFPHVRGMSPGGVLPKRTTGWQNLVAADGAFHAEAGWVDDPVFRAHKAEHQHMLPLVLLVAGLSLFILIGFPLFLRTGFIIPLSTVLAGVQRLEQGDRNVQVTTQSADELGRLAEGINQLTQALVTAETLAHQRAHEMEAEVTRRTAEAVDQKQRAEEARALIEEQATKLRALDRAKSAFFANLSHEFRTPLSLILGPTEALLGTIADTASQHQLVLIQRNAERLLGLIEQLLELATLESGELTLLKETQDVTVLVKGLVQAFSGRAAAQSIALEVRTDGGSCYASLDAKRFEQVVANLIINALQHTPASGHVTVEVRHVLQDQEDWVEVAVADTGYGVNPNDVPFIFDRFYRGKRKKDIERQGTGIGLAVARELTELHGGSLDVMSQVGHGATFTVRLPMMPAPASEKPSLMLVKRQAAFSHARTVEQEPSLILLIEDHAELRTFIRGALESGYQVAEAERGEEGIELAIQRIPDLIICDVMLPGVDGLAVTRHLKTHPLTSHIPIIVLTAKAGSDNLIAGLETGADVYLTKPFKLEEVQAHIASLLAQRQRLQAHFDQNTFQLQWSHPARSMDEQFMERVQAILHERHTDAAYTVEAFSQEAGLSASQFIRKIRGLTGQTPVELLRTYRLHQAAHLLQARVGSVKEVCYKVGFNSPSYFTKCFRETFGVAPSKYGASGDARAVH